MSSYIFKAFMFLSLIVLLSSCSNNNHSEESQNYFNKTYPDLRADKVKTDESAQAYMNLILDSKPKEGMDLLNNTVIPDHEALLEKIHDVELTETDLIKFNNLFEDISVVILDKRLYSKKVFEDIIEAHENDLLAEFDTEKALQPLYELNEKHLDISNEQVTLSKKLVEEYDALKLTEINPITVDVNVLNAAYDELIASFIEGLDELSLTTVNNHPLKIDRELLSDQGNPEIVFDGEIIVSDNYFSLKGHSNLLGGSILNVKSYQYGAANPYFKGDFQIEENGDFSLEMDIDKNTLDDGPFVVQIGYLPATSDDVEAHNIYGKDGSKLEGPFIHKYTDIKTTRFGAFAYAYLELTPGTKVKLSPQDINILDDSSNLNVTMEKYKVETKDNYYDITMNSNLHELTKIEAAVKVVDHDIGELTSNAIVGPDGSFRFRIPRPNPDDIDHNDVIINIEATSDGAIETEELYGPYGENFEGKFTKDTKRGKKIQYDLHLGNDS